jgi:WxL Interacting Protein, peptidoglycan binding domain
MLRRLTLAALIAAAFAPAAQASGPAFGIRALVHSKLGYFVYDAKPGTRVAGKVQITNTGNRVGTVKLFAADATTGQTSGTVYLTSGEKRHDVGAWVRLPAAQLELGPGETRVVPFTVVVPAGAAVGQHVGGIVAETAQQATGPKSKGKANVQITVRNLAIVAVQVNVPGPTVSRFSILGVRAGGRKGYQQVLVRMRNAGNVMAKPSGSITIEDSKGNQVLSQDFQLDTFLPRTTIDYPVNVTKEALDVGTYSTRVELSYAGGGGRKVVHATPTLRVTPANVSQVFTSAAPPTPPPAGTSTDTTASGGPTAAPGPSSSADSGGGGLPTGLIVVLAVAGGLALLGAGYFLALRTARKS